MPAVLGVLAALSSAGVASLGQTLKPS